MRKLTPLFDNNRQWARRIVETNPNFFNTLSEQQRPEYLWIGCSDSRVPANEIVGLLPGELFVHRNVANVVVHTDHNCLSVMQYAVEVLKVKHVIVTGHYGCGGVRAAMDNNVRLGLINNWLRHVQDVHEKFQDKLDLIEDPELRHDRLCELNVIEQVRNVCMTNILHEAWQRGQDVTVHGWIYRLRDGLVRDLSMGVTGEDDLQGTYRAAVENVFSERQGI